LRQRLREGWLPTVVHVGALAPLAIMVASYVRGRYFDPVRQVTTGTGRAAIVLLVLTLACTPVAVLTGWRRVLRVRKALGLYSFLYVSLHFLTFAGWDYGFRIDLLGPALFRQNFVVYGLAALALLVPLAITSTRGWQARLGRKWRWLHMLFYPAAILAVVHYLRLSKDPTVPLRYGVVVLALLAIRLPSVRRGLRQARLRVRAWAGRGESASGGPINPRT
jgi:sulfoxide reductase heme-binding subunit YedZ